MHVNLIAVIEDTATKEPHPGGTLFRLPREVRDKIYGGIVIKTYLIYGQPFYHGDHHRKPLVDAKADLAILRTCKAISQEASSVMFSKALFRYAIDYYDVMEKKLPTQPPKSLTDRIMNVDFILNQASYDDSSRNDSKVIEPSKLKPLIKGTMERFTGHKVRRSTCRVLLWAIEYPGHWNGFLSSPMASAMQKMTGFTAVTYELEDQNVSLADEWAQAEFEIGGMTLRRRLRQARTEIIPKILISQADLQNRKQTSTATVPKTLVSHTGL